MTDKIDTIILTAEIVAAFVGHNTVSVADVPNLIRTVHGALEAAGQPAPPMAQAPVAKATAAQIRKSITPDALISFEDGRPYKTLKRHLSSAGLTLEAYRAKWGLPKDYPSVAPAYSEARSAMAKALGLGTGGRGGRPAAAPNKAKTKGKSGLGGDRGHG